MKVILTQRVQALGNVGEIVNVTNGHARNFLIPQGYAIFADDGNKKVLENQKRRLAKAVESEKLVAQEIKSKLDGKKLEFVRRVAPNGKLFGTVSFVEIANQLEKEGINVEKKYLQSDRPLKSTGQFNIKAKLFNDVVSEFEVDISMDPNQIEEEKKKQAAAKKAKAQKEEEAKEAQADGQEETVKEEELTDDEKLNKEARDLLRS